jgi:hypothetical protein
MLQWKRGLWYLIGDLHVSFVEKEFSRHTGAQTFDFCVVYLQFLRISTGMVPENKSKRFPSREFQFIIAV